MQGDLKRIETDVCYVVIVNYNNWKDTIECVESVLKSNYRNYKIIICDNNSKNDSWERMIDWAEGRIQASCSEHPKIKQLVYPLAVKPIDFDYQYQNGDKGFSFPTARVNFVKLKKNLGFAGGMNVGIRLALKDETCGYIWCLNNDTVVGASVMRKMVEILKEHNNCGICSSYTRPYNSPDIKDLGEKRYYFNKWFGNNISYIEKNKKKNVACMYDGASFVVTRTFIEHVGLMEEKYFLYHEEPDWAIRGKQKGYEVVFYPQGIVYHKGGQSTHSPKGLKSYLSDYYLIRGRILITRKFYPYCLPTVYLGIVGSMLLEIRAKKYNRIWMILKLMINPNPLLDRPKERED